MKKLILSLACSFALSAAAFAQSQSIALYTSGSMSQTSGTFGSSGTFSLDVYVTFTGFTANGLSFWLQTQNAFAPSITITNEQYFTFTDPNDGPAPGSMTPFNNKGFTHASGNNTGMLSDQDLSPNPQTGTLTPGDLGATGAGQTAGTYKVATITFTLSGAPNGTFTLGTTTLNPKASTLSDTAFAGHSLPNATYTVSIVPEPSTIACLVCGVGVLGATFARRNRRR